jgi:LuxR family quorum sensing-dependent transcriptional regulator
MSVEMMAFDFIDRLKTCTTVDAVLADLQRQAGRLGFDHFLVTGLPMPHEPLSPLVMLNAWPEGWFARYTAENYFRHDGVGQWALRSTEPFMWSEVPPSLMQGAKSRRVMDEATDFGLIDGYLVPMFSSRHWQSAVAFASCGRCDLDNRSLAAAQLMAISAVGQLRRILGDVPAPRQRLTAREAECLTWIAAGKTVHDVADILGLSWFTVQTHLRNVRTKLDVASITQAVVEAIRSGELRI